MTAMERAFLQAKARKENNERVLEMLRAGGGMSRVPTQATWWPPRPMISKDPKEIKRLYGEDEEK